MFCNDNNFFCLLNLLLEQLSLLSFYVKFLFFFVESLDILETWVVELFSEVKKGNPLKVITGRDIPIWKFGKLYRLEAVKDVHVLKLSWSLPCLHKEYLKKPEDYLAYLLGHG